MEFTHMNRTDSLTISLTTIPMENNTDGDKMTMSMTMIDVKTPPRPNDIEMFMITDITSTPITITIPQMNTQQIIDGDNTLPDLTQIDAQQNGPNNT